MNIRWFQRVGSATLWLTLWFFELEAPRDYWILTVTQNIHSHGILGGKSLHARNEETVGVSTSELEDRSYAAVVGIPNRAVWILNPKWIQLQTVHHNSRKAEPVAAIHVEGLACIEGWVPVDRRHVEVMGVTKPRCFWRSGTAAWKPESGNMLGTPLRNMFPQYLFLEVALDKLPLNCICLWNV